MYIYIYIYYIHIWIRSHSTDYTDISTAHACTMTSWTPTCPCTFADSSSTAFPLILSFFLSFSLSLSPSLCLYLSLSLFASLSVFRFLPLSLLSSPASHADADAMTCSAVFCQPLLKHHSASCGVLRRFVVAHDVVAHPSVVMSSALFAYAPLLAVSVAVNECVSQVVAEPASGGGAQREGL